MTGLGFAARAAALALALLPVGAVFVASGQPALTPPKKPRTLAMKPTSAPQCDPAGFRVILDVGHTAEVRGAKSARGAHEYDFNLRLAKVIEHDLLDAGFSQTVLMITAEPPQRGLFKRVSAAAGMSGDLFLSIHHDSVPNWLLERWQFEGEERGYCDRFSGHSIFVSTQNGSPNASLSFARLLGLQLKARGLRYAPHYTEAFMGYRRRQLLDAEAGVYRYDQLVVLKETRMPAVLLEAGSIINRDEELAMMTPERQATISAAVTEAVKAFCAVRATRSPSPLAGGTRTPAGRRPAASRPAAAILPAGTAAPHY